MKASIKSTIQDRVRKIEAMPAIPSVFLPLLNLLNNPSDHVKLDEVVRLVSYDNTIAAQCLRVAASPLFGLSHAPKTIKAAVVSLGLRRVETILLTCCLGQAFPAKKWVLPPELFWRHSLGCAMVCRKLSEKVGADDHEKAYMSGLLHDIGFMVNGMVFTDEFAVAMEQACREGVELHEAEQAVMGFTHSDAGAALAERWHMAPDIIDVVGGHHRVDKKSLRPLVALVHLSDLLCRMRGLGYGYYERHMVDLVADPAWSVLQEAYRGLDGIDLVRFTFELDEDVAEIQSLVAMVFGGPPPRA